MKTIRQTFELQIDEKSNGITIRLNDASKCFLRICNIPKGLVYTGKKINEFIDVAYPTVSNEKSDADKALAILKAFHNIAHDSEKNEGITIVKDWDLNTLSIYTKKTHAHYGQMNCEDEKGFSMLIDELYRNFSGYALKK